MDYFNHLLKKTTDAVKERAKYVETDMIKKKIGESYETAKKTAYEHGPKVKDAAYKTYDSTQKTVTNFSGSINRFSRYTRYSMVLAGTGVFLFGVGYALRPVADIYRERQNQKKIDD